MRFNFSEEDDRDTCYDEWPLDEQQLRGLLGIELRNVLNLSDDLLDEVMSGDWISNEQRNILRKDARWDRFFQILRRRSLTDYKRFVEYIGKKHPSIKAIFTSTGGTFFVLYLFILLISKLVTIDNIGFSN